MPSKSEEPPLQLRTSAEEPRAVGAASSSQMVGSLTLSAKPSLL